MTRTKKLSYNNFNFLDIIHWTCPEGAQIFAHSFTPDCNKSFLTFLKRMWNLGRRGYLQQSKNKTTDRTSIHSYISITASLDIHTCFQIASNTFFKYRQFPKTLVRSWIQHSPLALALALNPSNSGNWQYTKISSKRSSKPKPKPFGHDGPGTSRVSERSNEKCQKTKASKSRSRTNSGYQESPEKEASRQTKKSRRRKPTTKVILRLLLNNTFV